MSIGFAGSKSIDERRRRRLAQEGMEAPSSDSGRTSRRKSPRKSAASQNSAESSQSLTSDLMTARAAVHSRLWQASWKYGVLIGFLIVANCSLVLHVGWTRGQTAAGVTTTLQTVETWLLRYLPFAYCLAVSHFAWLIYYHRSRSRLDFGGQYRLWIWMAALWTVIMACALSGWHERFGYWLAGKTTLREWKGPLWCWLIPAAAALLSNTRLLTEEFTPCRIAWRLHLVSLVSAGIAGTCLLLQGTSFDGVWMMPALALASTLWPTLELGAFLLFARYVVYVSNEPSVTSRPKRVRRIPAAELLQKVVAWVLEPREELPAYGSHSVSPPRRRKKIKSPANSKPKASANAKKARVSVRPSKPPAAKSLEAAKTSASSEVSKTSVSIPEPKKTEPPVLPQTPPPPREPQAKSRTEPDTKTIQSVPGPVTRIDTAHAVKGPHLGAAQRKHEEAPVVAGRKEEDAEDDFGDVDAWGDDEREASRHKRMKGKKKRRR